MECMEVGGCKGCVKIQRDEYFGLPRGQAMRCILSMNDVATLLSQMRPSMFRVPEKHTGQKALTPPIMTQLLWAWVLDKRCKAHPAIL